MTGRGRCARRVARRRRPTSATAIRAGPRRCARCWRHICVACAAQWPTPSAIVICAAGSRRGSTSSLRSLAREGDSAGGVEDPGDDEYFVICGRARHRGGAGGDRRARDRSRCAHRERRGRRDPDPDAPVPDRHSAGVRAPPGAGELGDRTERDDRRGRLRRRVPLRPRSGRRAAGPRPGTGGADRHGEQVAGAVAAAGLGGVPGRTARGGERGEAARATGVRRVCSSSRSRG